MKFEVRLAVLSIVRAWNKKEKGEREGHFCKITRDPPCLPPSVVMASSLELTSLSFIFPISSSPPPWTRPPSSEIPQIFLKTACFGPNSTFPTSKRTFRANSGRNLKVFFTFLVGFGAELKHRMRAQIQPCNPALSHSASSINWGWIHGISISCNIELVGEHLGWIWDSNCAIWAWLEQIRVGLGEVAIRGSKIGVFKHLKPSIKPFEWVSSLESRWVSLTS